MSVGGRVKEVGIKFLLRPSRDPLATVIERIDGLYAGALGANVKHIESTNVKINTILLEYPSKGLGKNPRLGWMARQTTTSSL